MKKTQLFAACAALSLLCAAPPLHAASDSLPDLGEVGTASLSVQDETRLGQRIMESIRADAAYLEDAEINYWLQSLGEKLVASSDKAGTPFEFFVVSDASINAFALPGGHIGVHTGLIDAVRNESELAGVLSHEIAHVSQRHIAQSIGRRNDTTLMMLAAMLAAALAARSNPDLTQAAIVSAQAGAIQSELGYSRAFEREADRIGLTILERAGFDVRGMVSFFERLQQTTRLYESKNLPAYLRTHPLTQERIADMANRVAQMSPREHADSADFRFARAKLRAGQGLPSDAAAYFRAELKKDPNNAALRYGLAQSLYLGKHNDEAWEALAPLRESAASPFFDELAARIELARKRPQAALAIVDAALARAPQNRPLAYTRMDALLQDGQPQRAAELARDGVRRAPQDANYWTRLARASEALGKPADMHRAQAEVYALKGALPQAVEQLELARKSGGGDFYEQSTIDARLRELKQTDQEMRRSSGHTH
ncbi:MAG: M48 family metallopeptidase [Rhodocyclaceae bacterium]|nr:M48 family metallopeptidase [Rhodocyclaceae bacterium]